MMITTQPLEETILGVLDYSKLIDAFETLLACGLTTVRVKAEIDVEQSLEAHGRWQRQQSLALGFWTADRTRARRAAYRAGMAYAQLCEHLRDFPIYTG